MRPQHLHHRRVSMSLRLQTGETDRQRENTGNSLLFVCVFLQLVAGKAPKSLCCTFPKEQCGERDEDLAGVTVMYFIELHGAEH